MYSFCKDVKFAEQLVPAGFRNAYALIFVDSNLFWEGTKQDGIYKFFRGGRIFTGLVRKPTGKQDDDVLIEGAFTIDWQKVNEVMKYALIKVK